MRVAYRVLDWAMAAETMAKFVNRGYSRIEAGLLQSFELTRVTLWTAEDGIISRKDKRINRTEGNLITANGYPGIKAYHPDGITKAFISCWDTKMEGFYFDWPDFAVDIFRHHLKERTR